MKSVQSTPQNNTNNILFIDSDKEVIYKLQDYISENKIQEKKDCNFIFVNDLNEALKTIKGQKINLIVLEVVLPIINGFYLLMNKKLIGEIPVIIYSKLTAEQDLKKMIESENVINIFNKKLTTVGEVVSSIIKKENKKTELREIINEIKDKAKSLDDDKMAKALSVLQCPNCHMILTKESRFCNNCGQKITQKTNEAIQLNEKLQNKHQPKNASDKQL